MDAGNPSADETWPCLRILCLLDALDSNANKSALNHCNKLLKKHPEANLVKVSSIQSKIFAQVERAGHVWRARCLAVQLAPINAVRG